jgi:serine/threonine-protein kinase SRK2
VQLQARLGAIHPNIVAAHELVLTASHMALVLEYAPGGTLTDAVVGRWESALERGGLHLTEPEARFLFRQFADAIAFCHASRVAHRDLKLDNTLLDGPLPAARVKLCDFGFARAWGADGPGGMHTALGTPVYMSPQIIGSKYSGHAFDGAAADVRFVFVSSSFVVFARPC